ncbi:MAG: winged helix-turn-helix transcriptional regulator [Candidatus Lokiarchaeota archaeon]|nr:winged helix-turn-helix transcriptional regulator [Candidatus Lokiarchaeota archaeon]
MRKVIPLLIFILILFSLYSFFPFYNNYINKSKSLKSSLVNLPDNNLEINWNNGTSSYPDFVIDNNNNIHIVWSDTTEGIWGDDSEIMYQLLIDQPSGENTRIISDGFGGWYGNEGNSVVPKIAIDHNEKLHAVWEDNSEGLWGTDYEIMYASSEDGISWSNTTVISDGYGGYFWNNGSSYSPSITIDNNNKIHVVWYDYTEGPWGGDYSDSEIMYVSSEDGISWSNATVISDGYGGYYWNTGWSESPVIANDNNNKIYIIWSDYTEGIWGYDQDIVYVSSIDGISWSNVSLISDDLTDWNNRDSISPDIMIDNTNTLHVVWSDDTDGIWGTDREIMYASSIDGILWSNATVISDGYSGYYWNNNNSYSPSLSLDNINTPHVVWSDDTDGIWGTDREIMHVSLVIGILWSNATVISDGYNGYYWNDGASNSAKIAFDNDNNIHIIWSDDTDGNWGIDREIMHVFSSDGLTWTNITILSDQLSSLNYNSNNIYEFFFQFNLIFSSILLGLLILISLLRKKLKKNQKSIQNLAIVDISSITLSTTIAIPQVLQIQYNSSLIVGNNLINLLILIFPYFILILCLIIIILSIISLVISLDEYSRYIKKKQIYIKNHPNLDFEDIFENYNRRKIIKLILAEPGIHYNDLLRKCDLYPGQLQWHLNVLLEFCIIKKDKISNFTIFLPNIQDLSIDDYGSKLVKSKTSLDILDLIEKNPGIISSTLAENLDLKKNTISYHINKLKKKKIIRSVKRGRELKIFLNEDSSKNEPQIFI